MPQAFDFIATTMFEQLDCGRVPTAELRLRLYGAMLVLVGAETTAELFAAAGYGDSPGSGLLALGFQLGRLLRFPLGV